jgi:hypothetical protein
LNALSNTSTNVTKEPDCWGMCPEFEMIDRQVTNDVSLFEAQIPFNPPQGKLIIDPHRAVKKFRRSAAGNYELSEDLRPPEVLLATTIYLMKEVLGDQRWPANNVSFAVIYAFIRDRLRAIRTDLTLQNCKNVFSIRIHELTIRFLIAAGHLLCEEERAAFEPQQNNEQLNGCLSSLREMYKTVRLTQPANLPILLKYEAEFQAYSIILSVDKKEAAVAISSLPVDLLQNELIQVALEAYSAFQQTNFIKFLSLIGSDCRTSYLQACLLHQFVLPVRQRGLTAMVSVGGETYKTMPRSDFIRWFNFVDEEELFYYSDRFGFRITNDFIDLSSLINRGEAFDLKAEEENFKIRKFQHFIEDQRRGGVSLSEKMFELMDLDLLQVMKVLENGENKMKLTSEYLAASSSSPLPKQREPVVKKFFTSKLNKSESADNFFNKPSTPTPEGGGHFSLNPAKEQDIMTSASVTSAPVAITPAPVIIDHQAVLRKKLELQAQERQARKEKIATVSEGMLEALVDSIVGFQVSESCTFAWENLYQSGKENRKNLIENVSKKIFEDILNFEILPKVLDVELMRIRCKAAESLTTKSVALNQATFTILSEIEREIYEENVMESFLNYKAMKLFKKVWFNRIKTCPQNCFDIRNFRIPQCPIHLLFIDNSKLLEPLIRSKPENNFGHLQTFLKQSSIKMICSFDNLIISQMMTVDEDSERRINLFNWPLNYPGPTVIIKTEDTTIINTNEFPWNPEILILGESSCLIEAFDFILKKAEFVKLPNLNQNISISQFITEELLQSFVIEAYEHNFENQEDELILFDLIIGLAERIIWILFKSPTASRLLSWHPLTSGRSSVIESIRKSQNIPETFLNLFKASKSFNVALKSIDEIYGNIFTANLEFLYTNQSISEIIRSQNQIITSRKLIKRRETRENSTDCDFIDLKSKSTTIDGLKEKLRVENLESEAYEQFLKKFL